MASYPPFPLACQDGPKRAGCGYTWETTAGPGLTIRCPHCSKAQRVPADRPRTAAAAAALAGAPITRAVGGAADPRLVQAWAQIPPWSDDDAAIMWRPDDSAGSCPACGRPRVAEPGRTMVCCPACWDWDDYPEVVTWRELQRSGRAAPARGAVTMAAQIRAGLGHEVECGRLERTIAAVLAADRRLMPDTREILGGYIRRIQQARTADDGPERLAVLRALWEAQPIERRGWRRRFDDTASYLEWLADHLADDQGDDDGPAVLEGHVITDDDAGSSAALPAAAADPTAGWWDRYDRGAASSAAVPDDGDRSPGWITRRAGLR